ncbi:MAG: ABC transporter ATP-binding protein [Reyranellaceae bacterium]
MAGVRLENVEKRYGDFVAVRGVDLEIGRGEFVTLLGASGSGKTTCLRMIAGFVTPTAGRVLIDDVDVTRVPPHRRQTGMVFQQYALFPHLTVAQNVSFGLQVRRLPRDEVRRRTLAALELVHLDGHAGRYPHQLSGGQRQRVALARAVVIEPRVLLLDEPLAALDLKLREELQGEIKRVQETLGITAVFVTHDQNEALGLSDRVVVMRDGGILQVDSPTALYRHPRSRYVANFVGRTNFLPAVVRDRSEDGTVFRLALDDGSAQPLQVRGHQNGNFPTGTRCLVAFRPEDARIAAAGPNVVRARLDKATYVGPGWTLSCTRAADEPVTIALPATAEIPAVGETIPVAWAPELAILLPLDGGEP